MIAHVYLKQNIILKNSKKLNNISRPFASVLFLHDVFIVRELIANYSLVVNFRARGTSIK